MRVFERRWIRPAYPGDGPDLARAEVSARARGGSAPSAAGPDEWERRIDRAPDEGFRAWIASEPGGRPVAAAALRTPAGSDHGQILFVWSEPGEGALAEAVFQGAVAWAAEENPLKRLAGAAAGCHGSAGDSARVLEAAEIESRLLQERRRISAEFGLVVAAPHKPRVLDLGNGADPMGLPGEWSIGRYDEKRLGMYSTELFAGNRNVHIGVDLGGPVGTPVCAFADGVVRSFAYNAAPGDYGNVVILEHEVGGRSIFALYGHLSGRSLVGRRVGQPIARGSPVGWIGDVHENGGWEHPHLHFQLAWEKPTVCDMPGTVTDAGRAAALRSYPDPRLVLGPIY